MDALRIAVVVLLVIYPSHSTVVDKGPQTFEPSEHHKRELKDEGNGYSFSYEPRQEPAQELHQPFPTAQPQPEPQLRYQQESSTLAPAIEIKMNQQQYEHIQPELHFIPINAVPQFVQSHQHQYAYYPPQQRNVQKVDYTSPQAQNEHYQPEKPLFTPAGTSSNQKQKQPEQEQLQQNQQQQQLQEQQRIVKQLQEQFEREAQSWQIEKPAEQKAQKPLHVSQQPKQQLDHQLPKVDQPIQQLQFERYVEQSQNLQLHVNQQEKQEQHKLDKQLQKQFEQQIQLDKQVILGQEQQLQVSHQKDQKQRQLNNRVQQIFQKQLPQYHQDQQKLRNQVDQELNGNEHRKPLVNQQQKHIQQNPQETEQIQQSLNDQLIEEYQKSVHQYRANNNYNSGKFHLSPYQTNEQEWLPLNGNRLENTKQNILTQPRQQYINIQFYTPPSQRPNREKQSEPDQLRSNSREQETIIPIVRQELNTVNDHNLHAQNHYDLQQYAPSYVPQPSSVDITRLKEEIAKDKARSQAQAEAIANSPPVVVNKHVSITRHRPVHYTRHVTVPVPSPIAVPFLQPVNIPVPQPYTVPVEIIRPFAVPIVQTQTVEVEKPVPYEVEKRVPVTVEKKVYYRVNRPVPVDRIVPVHITRKIPYKVSVHKPETLQIVRHVWKKNDDLW